MFVSHAKKAVVFGIIFLILSSCGKKPVQPEPKPQTNVKPPTKLDIQFRPVFDISSYFNFKTYAGNAVQYASSDFTTPEAIREKIEFLADEGVTFPQLLRAEIRARHYYRFSEPVIQRIFNFTDWYDQHQAKLGKYDENSLNDFERENLRRLDKIINENYPLTYWDR